MHQPLLVAGSILSLLLAAAASAQSTADVFVAKRGEMEFTGQMIAKPVQDDRVAAGGARETMASFALVEHQLMLDHYVFEVPEGETENSVAERLMATGDFEFVEPNWRVFPIGCPNDSSFSSQWHHGANRLDSCDGWDIHTGGPGTVVAICDTGLRLSHEDFQLHRQEGYNAVDHEWESNGGNIGPIHPHGTQTSGCAAANGNNGVGIAGIGWDLGHRMMRVSNSSGGGASLSDLQHAALTAVGVGDKVASVSYSGVNNSSNRSTATTIKGMGGLLVWAAGNDSANLNWGHRDSDDIIVAGATDSNDNQASFSAFGNSMDLVAPGVSVFTSDSGSDSDYTSVSGTSFSCPLVAGLCALIWSANPSLSPDEVEDILKQGCDDLGASGQDNTFGHGRIDIEASLALADDGGDGTLPDNGFLFSVKADETIGGVAVDDADVLSFNSDNGAVRKYIDFSDVNSGNADIDAFTLLPDGSMICSFVASENIDGLSGGPNKNLVDDEDLVRFVPTQTGENTTGSWEFYFDGSDVGMGGSGKLDIDAVSFDASTGDIHISVRGRWSLGGLSGRDEDVFAFTPTSLGSATAGSFSFVLDGSDADVKLAKGPEDIDAWDFGNVSGHVFLSTAGDYRVPVNLIGEDNDILDFTATALGSDPAGTFSVLFDGASLSAAMDIDGVYVIE